MAYCILVAHSFRVDRVNGTHAAGVGPQDGAAHRNDDGQGDAQSSTDSDENDGSNADAADGRRIEMEMEMLASLEANNGQNDYDLDVSEDLQVANQFLSYF